MVKRGLTASGRLRRRSIAIWGSAAVAAVVIAATLVAVAQLPNDSFDTTAIGSNSPHPGGSSSLAGTPTVIAPTIAPASSAAATTMSPSSTAAAPAANAAVAPRKAVPSTSAANPPAAGNGNFIFSDSFGGSALSSAWTVISRHGEYDQNETECNTPSEVSVANATLTIGVAAKSSVCGDFNLDGSQRTAPASWPYATGDVQWKSFNFTYGTVSITAKFPPHSTNTWPALWLLGAGCQPTNPETADTGYSTCPEINTAAYAEIDMVECYTNHWCQLALAQRNGSFPICEFNQETDASWHTYSLVWTPTSVSTAVDGVSTGCSFTAAGGYTIPSTPMFLIMQIQTGGVSATPNNAALPSSLQIKSVTVAKYAG